MPLTSAFLLSPAILLGRIKQTTLRTNTEVYSPTVESSPDIIGQSPCLAVPGLRICPLGDVYVSEGAGEA